VSKKLDTYLITTVVPGRDWVLVVSLNLNTVLDSRSYFFPNYLPASAVQVVIVKGWPNPWGWRVGYGG
jgi:hypothetical protein